MASIQIFQMIVEDNIHQFQKYQLDEKDILFIKVTSLGITLVSKTIVIRRSSTAPWMVPLFPLTSPGQTRAATHHRPSCSRLSPTRVVPLMLTRFDIKRNELKQSTNSLCLHKRDYETQEMNLLKWKRSLRSRKAPDVDEITTFF